MTRFTVLAALGTAVALFVAAAPLRASAQEDDQEDDEEYVEPQAKDHVRLMAWGGGLYDAVGKYGVSEMSGLEAAWAFESFDVGMQAQAYRLGPSRANTAWTPVVMGRFVQRFEAHPGVDVTLALGLGAGHTGSWIAWYQFAVGARVGTGPLFFAGEVGFERLDLFRFAAGVGVKF